MIDLRDKGLPKNVEVGGSLFFIKTDFREWLKFGEIIKNEFTQEDLEFLFVDRIPVGVDTFTPLLNFYINSNMTPHSTGQPSERLVDYIQDGEYIVSSFMAEYGINLTEVDMHWHLFKALFLGLSEKSKIKQIMSYRGYKKSDKKTEQVMNELKNAWSLDYKASDDPELIEEINDLFYNC